LVEPDCEACQNSHEVHYGGGELSGLTLMAVHFRDTIQLDAAQVVQRFAEKEPRQPRSRKLFCQSIIYE